MTDEQQFEAIFEWSEPETIEAVFQVNAVTTGKSYTHYQDQPEKTWTIQHNLNKYPSVTVVSSAGDVVYADTQYKDTNTIELKFSAAFGGKAYCN